ncbi:MAG: hypothetical protein N2376_08820 [Clostridia bacterium]|nr:hypothetical protein [Clostridia bacterium]
MKPFIVGAAALILALFCYSFNHDFGLNRHAVLELRTVCEEASVAGALFYDKSQYSSGRIVFNRQESIKAIEAEIKSMLQLDDDLNPTQESYWQNKITYKAYFYDDSNTTYPYLFVDPDTGFTHLIKTPTIIVTINAGEARYSLQFLKNGADNIRSAAHSWDGR